MPQSLLRVETLYYEEAALEHARGREIYERFSGEGARLVPVESHWRLDLNRDPASVEEWNHTKASTLVLGVKKTLTTRPNGRSADYIVPGASNGCAMACAYCYVNRRKGYANPITLFANITQIQEHIAKYAAKLGPKREANQCDPELWVLEIGENGDCSFDAELSDNVRDLVEQFRAIPNAKGTFATKYVNRDLLGYDPQGKTRIRFSLMPEKVARVVDVRTSPMGERIRALNDFHEAGYEVHLNFSPVIIYEGWRADYRELFRTVDGALSEAVKKQLACEVIFLTHNGAMHELNLQWHPKAEEYLWTPRWQEGKVSENAMENVRYRRGFKGRAIDVLLEMLREEMPYCRVRYAF